MERYVIEAPQIFTLFFVMLGPLRILGPYAHFTEQVAPDDLKRLSLRACFIAAVALFIGGFLGQHLLDSWRISLSVMELTGGLVFAFFAFLVIFFPPKSQPQASVENPLEESGRVAFSMIVTPYGMAVVILLLSLSHSWHRTLLILGLLFVVLILNLLAMLYVRQIMGKFGSAVLRLLGGVLSVLQAALAVQIIYNSLQSLR